MYKIGINNKPYSLCSQNTECLSKTSVPDMDTGNAGALEASGETGSKVRHLLCLFCYFFFYFFFQIQ